ncbi:MAG: NIPSNAP family protein [Sphingomonas sp.]|uniref:NIPSNAP family protein n=1 Tax=Sphingomonas sp. TaxID=28214 RepID=UPI001B176A99|nr:NIPSNAP family protein [Sphingomonas sp.]MBO9623038.1 NIPSNAP family protein [Sphingomonas sp.]
MRPALLACFALAAIAAPASAQQAAPGPRAELYELRTYYPAPGKLAALNARFREHTLKLFEKHGMRNVAYWNEQPTSEAPEGRVIYVLAYPSREAREASWAAFSADPEWRTVAARSEAGGKLVAKVESVFMTLTDYSPPLAPPRP